MGHNTGCVDSQYIHERESYEVLLAILKKRKKVTFADDADSQTKRPRLDSTVENEDKDEGQGGTNAVNEVQKVPSAKEIQPINLSQATTDFPTVLADAALATSTATQSNIPPNSLPDLVEDNIGGADCPCEEDDEEMTTFGKHITVTSVKEQCGKPTFWSKRCVKLCISS